MSTLPNPLQGVNASNPLGWPGQTGTNAPQLPGGNPLFNVPTNPVSAGPQSGNPAGLPNPGSNLKDAMRNAGFLNVQQGQQRNQLAPQMANTMFGLAGPAANYFQTLMKLGSPYYQQQQRASFEQGTQQAQNAAAGSRDQLNAAGYGYTPSGTTAATIGQEAQGQSQNLSQTFLQNLFQNENLQSQAGQQLSQLAAMFNPAQLFGSSTNITGSTQGPSAASQFAQVMGSLTGSGGVRGSPGQVGSG